MGKKAIPMKACNFVEDITSSTRFSVDKETRKLSIVGYSGGILDHWYFGKLAIDLEGVSFPKKKTPILMAHETEHPIGYTLTAPIIRDNKLVVEDGILLDNADAQEFAQNVDNGFPYQASISVKPLSMERVGDDVTAKVNGYAFKGPGTIFRACIYKEVSPCVFGVDSNTESTLLAEGDEFYNVMEDSMSKDSTQIDTAQQPSDVQLAEDVSKLKEELSKVTATLALSKEQESLQESTDVHKRKLMAVELAGATAFTDSDKEVIQLRQENKELESRLLRMEKSMALRQEQDTRAQFSAELKLQMASSGLPTRLQDKVSSMFRADTYLSQTDDGLILNVAKLRGDIKLELEDWKSVVQQHPVVLGGGARSPEKLAEACDDEDYSSESYLQLRAAMGLSTVTTKDKE